MEGTRPHLLHSLGVASILGSPFITSAPQTGGSNGSQVETLRLRVLTQRSASVRSAGLVGSVASAWLSDPRPLPHLLSAKLVAAPQREHRWDFNGSQVGPLATCVSESPPAPLLRLPPHGHVLLSEIDKMDVSVGDIRSYQSLTPSSLRPSCVSQFKQQIASCRYCPISVRTPSTLYACSKVLYPTHLPLGALQKGALALFSAVGAVIRCGGGMARGCRGGGREECVLPGEGWLQMAAHPLPFRQYVRPSSPCFSLPPNLPPPSPLQARAGRPGRDGGRDHGGRGAEAAARPHACRPRGQPHPQ